MITLLKSPLEYISDDLLAPSAERRARAKRRYDDLGLWLRLHASNTSPGDVRVYPQGSYALGTTNVHPVTNEFDVDLVVCIDVSKGAITQRDLIAKLAGWLGSYTADRQCSAHPELRPKELKKGGRAFTLVYEYQGLPFHIDILPVVPQDGHEVKIGEPSWLTDRTEREWQHTNPRGFVEHFHGLSGPEMKTLAKAADVDVEDLPDHGIATELQRTVRLLKQHRDHMFSFDPDKKAPPSVVITALATESYRRLTRTDVKPSVMDVVAGMGGLLTFDDNDELSIPNPTLEDENYADRYAGKPARLTALQRWLLTARGDFSAIQAARGPDRLERVGKSFGAVVQNRAAAGLSVTVSRVAGSTLGAAGGALNLAAPRPAPRKDFYGSPPDRDS